MTKINNNITTVGLQDDVTRFIEKLQLEICRIVRQNFVGCYLHGSLALGGFNKHSSDIDLLVVTKTALTISVQKELAKLFLSTSTKPYPIEITFFHVEQLKVWSHPCPYDFHYSEYWRDRFVTALQNNSSLYFNLHDKTDVDLAAHLTILHKQGICLKGKPIHKVFPTVPKFDYLDALLSDYNDCLDNMEHTPVYCILNLLRVYLFVKEERITSKQEAGFWGSHHLPQNINGIAKKALLAYETNTNAASFHTTELCLFKAYIDENVQQFLNA